MIDQSKLTPEISSKYTVENNTFLATPKDDSKDRVSVEIGDSKQVDFLPQLKVMRWDNEANVSLRLKDFDSFTVETEADKIKLDTADKEVHLYETEEGHEFEVILKEKPKTNVVEFTIEDKNVEYFYQPPLTEVPLSGRAVRATETDMFNKDGESISHRPENVVGSYAVYMAERGINFEGGKIYRTGKIAQIYRPKIIDAKGTEVWGSLKIENGILSVTIPQDFLDKAVYPVRHAAGLTFGYTTTSGASYNHGAGNYLLFSSPGYTGAAGTGVSISASLGMISGNGNAKFSLYTLVSTTYTKVTNGLTAEVHPSGTGPTTYTGNFVSAPTLSAVTYFIMMDQDSNNEKQFYDTSRTGHTCYYEAADYTTVFPADFTSPGTDYSNSEYTIYCTYTDNMAVTKRFYPQNSAAPYSPASYHGAWDASGSIVDMRLGNFPFGANATKGVAETNATANWDVMLARFVSDPIGIDYTFTTSDTINWVLGVKSSSLTAVAKNHVHIWVTQGDSNTERGVLISDSIGATTWPTASTGTGEGEGATAIAGTVAALAGDRIVVEFGYRDQEASATSRTGTLYYGSASTANDLTVGATTGANKNGWIEFVTATTVFPINVSATGTWTCPTETPQINQITAECWGGGGAGSASGFSGNGGGGGGGYSLKTAIAVAGGTGYSVTVGTGGTGVTGGAGNSGNDSKFNNGSSDVCVGKGGTGASGAPHGAGGISGTGDTKYTGGNGGDGGVSGYNYGGGGGGGAGTTNNGGVGANNTTSGGGAGGTGTALGGGNGGAGGGNGANGNAGLIYGGGGGGASSTPNTGGAGANGLVILTPTGIAAAGGAGPAKLKTFNGLPVAKVKTVNGLPVAKWKTWNGLV